MSRLDVSLTRPSALTQAERLAWDAFVDADPCLGSPYFERAFAECCEEARSDTRVLVARRDGAIKAFLPLQTGKVGYARPLAGPLGDVQGLIAEPGAQIDPAELLRKGGVPLFDYSAALASQACWRRGGEIDGSWVVDISDGYDAWEESRRSVQPKPMRNLRTRRRRLEEADGGFSFIMADYRPEAFEAMIRWKRGQYQATKVFDVFSVGWTRRLLEAILRRRTDRFSGVCSTLNIGGEIAAVHVGMASARTTHYWFPAYDPDFSTMSPGLLLMTEMIRTAASFGQQSLELGPGQYAFKKDLATHQVGLVSGFVAAPSLLAVTRMAADGLRRAAEAAPIGRLSEAPGKALRKIDRLAGYYAA